MGALQWNKFSILVDPKQITVVSKSEKKRFYALLSHLLLCHWGPSTYFLMQILLRLVGPNLFGGGPANDILRGALSAAADS